jgi:hypothetical protein
LLKRLHALAVALLALVGCDLAYPEVVVVNRTAAPIQLRNLAFSGCVWDRVLGYGEATSPGRCLPGDDRVHFEKLDTAAYCREQAEDGTIDGLCPCDGGVPDGGDDAGTTNPVPTWFNYQTVTVHRVGYGEFHVFEVTVDDMEQDFSVPGPYGH